MARINNNNNRTDMERNGLEKRLLSPKQEAAALAMAAGASIEDTARDTDAGTTTIKRWLSEQPEFARRITELRAEMTSRVLGKLIDGMTSAADTLGYLSRKGKSEQVRLGASRALIELGVKLRDSVELEARIAALEGNQPDRLRQSA